MEIKFEYAEIKAIVLCHVRSLFPAHVLEGKDVVIEFERYSYDKHATVTIKDKE